MRERPELASCLGFESELRGACARVMSAAAPACPEALRARVQSMRAEPRAGDGGDTLTMGGSTRARSFWQRGGALSAVAAALLLAGGALIWNSASVLSSNPGAGAAPTTRVSYAQRVGDFVAAEHTRCLQDPAASAKFDLDDLGAVRSRYSARFDSPVRVPGPLSDTGMRFYGAGDCGLPSTAESAHMRFDIPTPGNKSPGDKSSGDKAGMHLSLFVTPDPGLLGLEDGVTYAVDSEACASRGASMFVWSLDGVLYVLVSEAERNSDACVKIRDLVNAPTTTRPL